MVNQITTYVTIVSQNNVSDEDVEEVLEARGADSLQEVASDMEESVEALIADQLFREADAIPMLDVTTEVEEVEK